MSGAQVPLAQLADIRLRQGPGMIRNENGLLSGYVYVDVAGRDIGSYVTEAKKIVSQKVPLPTGYALQWSGQYENMARVRERLKVVLPLTFVIIIFLLFMNTKSWAKTGIVMMAVPFSLIGSVWLLWALDYNLSVAVWVGFIALAGLDAETGMFMLLYLELAYDKAKEEGRMASLTDLRAAIHEGAVKRVRPKVMTVAVDFVGLLPVMIATGTGADVMKRVAAPLVGGLASSFLLELLVYPVIFWYWKGHTEGLMTSKRPWVNGFWKAVARIG
jgi:Cu(I)/Ag(I) efflux system membrane protein CusA/SilA